MTTRAGRGRRWVNAHADTRPTLGPAAIAAERADEAPDHTVRLDPRDDAGVQMFEEDHDDRD
ncbi:hypothetical protein [Rhodococcus sp. NPDC003348]